MTGANSSQPPLSAKNSVLFFIFTNVIIVLVVMNSDKAEFWVNVVSVNISLMAYLFPQGTIHVLGKLGATKFIQLSPHAIRRLASVTGVIMFCLLMLGGSISPCNASEPVQCPPMATPTYTPVPSVIVTVRDGANLRRGPGTNYDIANTAFKGQQLTVLGFVRDWYLVLAAGNEKVWINSELVILTSGDLTAIPTVGSIPPPPTHAPPVSPKICNPEEFNPVCGSNNCAADYTSQCNKEGTGWTCVWDPSLCPIVAGPVFPPAPPHVPTPKPGEPPPEPFVCTQSWLDGKIQEYGSSLHPPLNLAQTKALLISQGYDRDHDGDLDCDDYRAITGQG